jgi:hypothetical protein
VVSYLPRRLAVYSNISRLLERSSVSLLSRQTILLFLPLVGPACTAAAQETSVDPSPVCERATQNVQRSAQGEAYSSAIGDLPSCGAAGVRALKSLWGQPPSDTAAVRVLGEATPRLRDQQMFNEVVSVFQNTSRPREVRLAALEALVGYFQPGLALKFTEPDEPVQHGSAYVMLGQGDPPTTRNGPTPLAARVRGDVLEAVQRIGKEDKDERLRLISAYIHTRLRALR